MIKGIGKVLGFILLSVNILMSLIFILCSFSSYIYPARHPVLSCAGLAFPIFLFITIAFLIFWLICYRKYSIISFVTLLICIKPIFTYAPLNFFSSSASDDAIKILSYNTMAVNNGEMDEDGHNAILEYIKKSDADIVCLQELTPGNGLSLDKIKKELSEYKYNDYHKISGSSNGLGIFSRFPILSAEPLIYESRNNGSMTYKLKVKDDTLVVINNHLESNKLTVHDKKRFHDMIKESDKDKVESGARLLIGKLASASSIRCSQADSVAKYITNNYNLPIIVCGDFNDTPLSYTHHLLEKYLKDAYVDSGFGPGISYNQNHFYFRIDHILVSEYMKTYNCTVDHSIKYSDHYPIWCYVKM